MTRGELAKRTGCNIETIRYYEKIGLLPPPPRTSGGHRVYAMEDLNRLSFIRRCRELGFSQEQIRGVLELVDGGHFTCADIHSLTMEHVGEIRAKIADLRKIEGVLVDMAAQCSRGDIPECRVIEALFSPDL